MNVVPTFYDRTRAVQDPVATSIDFGHLCLGGVGLASRVIPIRQPPLFISTLRRLELRVVASSGAALEQSAVAGIRRGP